MHGCYYLHTNGDLIYKPEAVFNGISPAEYFEGNFVVMWWSMPKCSPTGTAEGDVKWMMDWMYEAYKASLNKDKTKVRIYEICSKQGFDVIVPDTIIKGKKEQ